MNYISYAIHSIPVITPAVNTTAFSLDENLLKTRKEIVAFGYICSIAYGIFSKASWFKLAAYTLTACAIPIIDRWYSNSAADKLAIKEYSSKDIPSYFARIRISQRVKAAELFIQKKGNLNKVDDQGGKIFDLCTLSTSDVDETRTKISALLNDYADTQAVREYYNNQTPASEATQRIMETKSAAEKFIKAMQDPFAIDSQGNTISNLCLQNDNDIVQTETFQLLNDYADNQAGEQYAFFPKPSSQVIERIFFSEKAGQLFIEKKCDPFKVDENDNSFADQCFEYCQNYLEAADDENMKALHAYVNKYAVDSYTSGKPSSQATQWFLKSEKIAQDFVENNCDPKLIDNVGNSIFELCKNGQGDAAACKILSEYCEEQSKGGGSESVSEQPQEEGFLDLTMENSPSSGPSSSEPTTPIVKKVSEDSSS